MDKLESWKRTEDIEIDLMDLLRSICMRWKQALACALLGALVLGGYGWMRGKHAAAAGSGAAGETELTEEEEQGVEAAVRLQAENEALEEYLEKSVLMQIDPYHKNRAVMLYSIEGAKRRDLQKIVECYLNFAANGGAADELGRSGSWDMEKSFLSELVTAYRSDSGAARRINAEEGMQDSVPAEALFTVEAAGESAETARRLASDMQDALEKEQKTIAETAGSHKLLLASCSAAETVDNDLLTDQHDKRALLKTNIAEWKTLTDAFSGGQKAAYAKAAGLEGDGALKGTGSGQRALTDAADPAVSAKHILIGLAGGIFIYCFVSACLYMFRDTVKSIDELKRVYAFPFYGGIRAEKKTGGAGLKKKAGGRPCGPQHAAGEQAQAACRIRLACRSRGITELYLSSDFSFTGREKECLDGMISLLEEAGISAHAAENAGSAAGLWDDMVKAGSVLLVCRIGTTTRHMIDEQMMFYMENGIAVAGAVAFTE